MGSTLLEIIKSTSKKPKPQADQLGFGKHMFIMDYEIDKGWNKPRIMRLLP